MTMPLAKLFPTTDAAGFGGNDPGTGIGPAKDDELDGVLAELRASLDKLKIEVAAVAERHGEAVSKGVSAGAEQLRTEIRKAPGLALAVAAVTGVVVAIALTSTRPVEPEWRQTARRYQSGIRDDLDAIMTRARQAADDARASTSGLIPSVERLAQTLSQMDVNSTLAPAIEKGSTLLRSAWLSLTGNR